MTNGLSGDFGPPKPFEYSSYHNYWVPQINQLYNEDLLSPNYGLSDDESTPERRSTKRKKKSKKKHSESSRRKPEHRIEGYILQVIGILCFILAAVKSFEPLTGVGFTLVLIGYNKNVKKNLRVDINKEGEKEKPKRKTRKHQEKEIVFAVERCDLRESIVREEEH